LGVGPSISPASFNDLKGEVDKYASGYDWDTAIKFTESFLKKVNPVSTDGRIFELLGDYYYNLAFQQCTRDDFKQIILRARRAYEKASDENRCKARAGYCSYLASDDPGTRRELIVSACLPPAREALVGSFSSNESEQTLVRVYVELLEYLTIACSTSLDAAQVVELVKETKLSAGEAFLRFRNSNNPETLILITNSYLRLLEWTTSAFLSPDEEKRIAEELLPVSDNLRIIVEKVAEWKIKSLAYEAMASIYDINGDTVRMASMLEIALNESRKTGDQNLIGWQCMLLGYSLGWVGEETDISEQRKELFERAIQCSSTAIEHFSSSMAWTAFAYRIFVQRSVNLARDAPQVSTKLEYLDRAIEFGKAGLENATYFPTYCTEIWPWIATALTYKAELTFIKAERENLLSEAVNLNTINLQRYVCLVHPDCWNRGVAHWLAGLAQSKLAGERVEDVRSAISLLQEGASNLKTGQEICSRTLTIISSPAREGRLATMCEDLGNALLKLYHWSQRKEDYFESIEAYDKAVLHYSKANLIGFLGPITWKIAKLYDSIQEYSKSSSMFAMAADQFEAASKTQKSLRKTFADLSLYMRAWSKIEESRLAHIVENYLSSSEKLKEAYSLLQETESFQFLTKHYEAYSKIEEAEDYSRKEKNKEAAEAFGSASDLFAQAEKAAREHGKEADDSEWVTISKNRGRYSAARKSLEEARILDRNGQAEASMHKYKAVADVLKEVGSDAAKQEDTSDIDALSLLCQAFAAMKEAEVKSSPELYSKASKIFLKARENVMKQSFVLSCLANSSICEALEGGTKFKKTKDVQLYSQIKKQLGAASEYYEEAGFEKASEWTRATEALFDALVYLASAEGEVDPSKKTQMYHLAEKHLELSARRYADIGYEKKRQEVLRHLKIARENRELLISPIEALSQSPLVSSTPTNLTRDQAVGLERFEVANLTGNFSISTKLTSVGSSITIEIDVANIGKTPALLMKLDNIAPSHGFEIELEENNAYRILEDESSIAIDLRGKRLEYLKAHDVTVRLVAKSKGHFELKPRILFVDELGKYRSYEFEPQSVQIKNVTRKLAAIMFTDLAGYTALGQRHEALSLALVQEQRKLLRPIFKKHNGREVKTMGDAFLVEFESSLEAARCAYDIQRATRELNFSLPEDKRIQLRIGVHLGDILEVEDGDISGDAVNVASRIDPLADRGGVCLTRQVYDNIQNKFDLKLESLGPKTLKNVSYQIEVFKMVMPWE
jgi:class 3 adenylate cyclase